MTFSLSRTMHPSDLDELSDELALVDEIAAVCGGWRSEQHPCRRWEYALALRAFSVWRRWYTKSDASTESFCLADVGPATGILSPILLSLSHDVILYEPWVYGDQTQALTDQMNAVKRAYPLSRGWSLYKKGLGALDETDRKVFHGVFCISTLEHISYEERAFLDLLSMARERGLVFLTMDFAGDPGAESAELSYEMHWMRERMYTPGRIEKLRELAATSGFKTLGPASWGWSEECRMVNNYGFSSLALVRGGE